MRSLNSAIRAELDADYRLAIKRYLSLSREGSKLDRVGIFQAIARCFEKLSSFERAAVWHERAGKGYMSLPNAVMGRQERTYYALVEYRAAVQDRAPNLSERGGADRYLKALAICVGPGKEGYSHEMLFAAHLCIKIRAYKRAAVFFADCGSQFRKDGQRGLARECYGLGAEYFEKSGNARRTRELRKRATAL